ncbi:uncharacterized protein [Dendrobates tinctorius]|uniref:uncharacterized protein isoform X2 n=1 Tax=Dendrobates tinctorius TaxID=92724 RepID=UPI003CC9796C
MESPSPEHLLPRQEARSEEKARRSSSVSHSGSARAGRHRRKEGSVVSLGDSERTSQPPDPDVPKKYRGKSKNKECALCKNPTDAAWNKKLCQECINKTIAEETPSFSASLRTIIQTEVSKSVRALQPVDTEGKNRRASPSGVSQQDSTESEDDSNKSQYVGSSSDGEDTFPVETTDELIKAVRSTMGLVEEQTKKTAQDLMFSGLQKKKRKAFPVNEQLKALIKREWEKPERKSQITNSLKRRYPFEEEASSSWDRAPKIDVAISKVARKSSLPFEDLGFLKEPLDRKVDNCLKSAWETSAGALRPAIAATCVARSLKIWTDNLEDQLEQGVPRDMILESLPAIRAAAGFLAEASADSARLASKSAALTNVGRRAVWLKCWPGDTQAKLKLCSLPCEGNFLFGPALDEVLEKASDTKKNFPKQPFQAFRLSFQRGRKFRRQQFKERDRNNSDRRYRGGRGFYFSKPPREAKKPGQ